MDSEIKPQALRALKIEELSQNMGWLRSLARGLVRDPSDAEDLAQATLCTAVASQSEMQDVRGFLAGVAKKLAWNGRRSDRHRADREWLSSRESAQVGPPPEDHLEAMETMRTALEEVDKLPAVQSRTISLRYVEELEIQAIAERMGSTPSTVRSNLSRGLATLRARLDERFGDRASWSLVLVPLAAPAGGSLGIATVAVKPALGLASLPTASIIMTIKFALAALAPIFLTAGYLHLGSEDSSLDPAPTVSEIAHLGVPDEMGEPPEGIDEPAFEEGLVAQGAAPTAGRQSIDHGSPAPKAAAIGGSSGTVELTFLNLSDQSPLFHFEVLVTLGTKPGGPAVEAGGEERRLTTDDSGRLTVDEVPAGTTNLSFRCEGGPTFVPSSVAIGEAGGLEPVLVYIGPTFPLAFGGAAVEFGTPMSVEITGPGVSRWSSFEEEVTWGSGPFVRFVSSFNGAGFDGPWVMHVRSHDGFLHGEASIEHTQGTFDGALAITLARCGVIRFVTPEGGVGTLEGAPLPFITIEPPGELAGEIAGEFVQLERSEGAVNGRIDGLAPGAYSWSAGGLVGESGDPLQGEVIVVANAVSEVELPRLGGPHLGRAIVVDASDAPEADLSQWFAGALSTAPRSEGLTMTHPRRAGSLGPGMWTIPIGPVAQAGWIASLTPADGFEVSPRQFVFPPSGIPPLLTVTRTAESPDVRLRLVDGRTGLLIPRFDGATAVHMDGFNPNHLKHQQDGSLLATEVPLDRSTRFLCRADGFRMQEVFFDPGNSPTEMTVSLEPGWSNFVGVVHKGKMAPLSGVGVTVDGADVGATDDEGRVWIEGSGPPKNVELRLEGTDWIQTISSIQSSADPETGYVFLVEDR